MPKRHLDLGEVIILKGQMDMEGAVHDAIAKMRSIDSEEIAVFLIDPVVLYILAATSKRCLTVSEMSPLVNLPVATCYKLTYQMERMGLIACCGTSRTSGRGKASVYTSVLKEMSLDVKNSMINVMITWKNGQTAEYHRYLLAQTNCQSQVGRPMKAEMDQKAISVSVSN
ncbi:MAG: hypothetical protein MIO87_00845 [Methanomassiliicoccales archaeon]|nr:hypothetical protein [Methanomassiliicoccales archaeon]